ncbi:type VII toxin-antitoxin system MntA family adenylyltransferase antitoxin [Fictibacillus barbaricus]|uniref:Nucleotidyltransferase domain-containing protein n=1 Tax=Fictibacillus barbaricus TaxID=182136 RepID=A0ABS2ZC02_9BACL|nr:nucleotidyltransferase domain-containing protein [Fictibacillus barbaricus]MBN3544189.1 nucleotidyltransferase domain-containing protein [Fictibacillus barbaricus]GGB69634.1 nucleotidyltransferase [Fictibacillus barbaricus]
MNKKIEERIVTCLREKIDPYLMVLFGSAAKGTDRSDSDIDIAFLSDRDLDDYDRFMLSQDLASLIHKEVDLIDLNKASTVFAVQVIGSGRVLFSKDEKKRMEFEMKTLKMYAKLNEERDIVLKKVGESGSIYEK